MATREILGALDPYLRTISNPVETIDDSTRALVAEMFETMYEAPGIGLAAIQIGVPQRILVIDLQRPDLDAAAEGEEPPPLREPRVFINPEILWESEDYVSYNEGCLSVPDLYADVERPSRIRAKWLDLDGDTHEAEIDGMLATCLQHEIDHLDGVLFIDYLSKLKRDMFVKKLMKAQRKAA